MTFKKCFSQMFNVNCLSDIKPNFSDLSNFFPPLFLTITTVFSILWASKILPLPPYEIFQGLSIKFSIGDQTFNTNLKHFVNDFMMSFFFFLLGLEIKKECLIGSLRNNRTRNMIFLAALGGVIIPAFIFHVLSINKSFSHGWAVPIATDTAFVLGILILLRERIPSAVFTFVAAFAVIDDLLAILVLAVFYTDNFKIPYLCYALTVFLFLISANVFRVRNQMFYLALGLLLWYFINKSGLHGTLAGILVAATIPAYPSIKTKQLISKSNLLISKLWARKKNSQKNLLEDKKKQDLIDEINETVKQSTIPLVKIHHKLEPVILFIILPFFVLINAGVPISLEFMKMTVISPLAVALAFSLTFGKFLGISLSCILTKRFNIGCLPEGMSRKHMIGVSLLAGIGFTMSLFVAELAFNTPEQMIIVKISILTASLMSAILGWCWLRYAS